MTEHQSAAPDREAVIAKLREWGSFQGHPISPTLIAAADMLEGAASMEQNDRRWRELFDGDHLLFVGQWCSKEGRDSGEGEWIMLMEEQVSAALGKEK